MSSLLLFQTAFLPVKSQASSPFLLVQCLRVVVVVVVVIVPSRDIYLKSMTSVSLALPANIHASLS